jgi:hypothetical protein
VRIANTKPSTSLNEGADFHPTCSKLDFLWGLMVGSVVMTCHRFGIMGHYVEGSGPYPRTGN